jgi:hypothetical protein
VQQVSNEFERVTARIIEKHSDSASLRTSAIIFLLGFRPMIGNIIGAGGLADKLQARKDNGRVGLLAKGEVN